MGMQKTIFDLFRQEDEQFSSRPSNDAWSKLERKLDDKKELVVPVRKINWWAIAASFVALVGAVFILQRSPNNSASKAVAENSMMEELAAFYVEDLVYTDSESDFQKEWQISNKYRALFADNKSDFRRNENLAYNKVAKLKPRDIQKSKIRTKPDPLIAEKRNNIEIRNTTADQSLIAENEIADPTTGALVIAPQNGEIAATESYDQSEDASSVSINMDVPAVISGRKSKSIVKKKFNDLNNLRWLVGNWEQKRADMKSVEKWVADSSNSIWGTGYLLQEDDTIFTENMCIKQIEDKIYFFQNIDTVNEQTKFVLTSSSSNNWNFTNSGGAPKNLIISNISNSKYEFEIQNIAPTQTQFLRQRNILQSNNAFRQMNKVD